MGIDGGQVEGEVVDSLRYAPRATGFLSLRPRRRPLWWFRGNGEGVSAEVSGGGGSNAIFWGSRTPNRSPRI